MPWTRSWHIRRCMSVVRDVRQNSESTVSPYRRTRCVPPGVGAARGVLEAEAEAEAEAAAAVAVEERRIGAIQPHVLRGEEEVGDAGAVLAGRKVLSARELGAVKAGRQRLERLSPRRPVGGVGVCECRRVKEAGAAHPALVRVVRPDGRDLPSPARDATT